VTTTDQAPSSSRATTSQPPTHGAGAHRSAGFRLSTFDALRYRDYRFLWTGVFFTAGGMWMEQIALNWIVYDMTGSAVDLGLLNAVRAFPSLLLAPFGGVAADRVDRKHLMLLTTWALVALYVGLAALIWWDLLQLWHLMLFSFVTGAVWTFNQPVRQALLPLLVPREAMMNAVALQSTAFNSSRVLGPAAGGLLMGWLGAAGAIFAVACSFIMVNVMTYAMRVPPLPKRAGPPTSVLTDMMEGFRYIGKTPDVRALMIMALTPFILIMPFMTLLTVFAKDIFHLDATGFGLLTSISGIGSLTATLVVASLGNYRGKGRILTWSGVAMGGLLIAFAYSPWLPLSYATLVLVSGASMAYISLTNTLLNLIVPNEFRGRVMAVFMLDRGMMPVGSMIAGGLAAALGAPAALALMGAASLGFVGLAFVVFPSVRKLD
jgi:MFS family permease